MARRSSGTKMKRAFNAWSYVLRRARIAEICRTGPFAERPFARLAACSAMIRVHRSRAVLFQAVRNSVTAVITTMVVGHGQSLSEKEAPDGSTPYRPAHPRQGLGVGSRERLKVTRLRQS